MGRTKKYVEPIKFTQKHVKDRNLVISMLKYENNLGKCDIGKRLYTNKLNKPGMSLFPEKTLNRMVLAHHGFTTDDTSVDNYRTIFKHYFKGPDDYDEEVINSVYYMKHNRIVFYKQQKPKIGEYIPDIELLNLDGTKTSLFGALDNHHKVNTVVGAFSES